jgi:hypothetical protein
MPFARFTHFANRGPGMDTSPVQSAITLASELDKQLLGLATGILALTITFYKDVDKGGPKGYHWFLYIAWALFLGSTLLGLLAMGKLVSLSLTPTDPSIMNNLDGASQWTALQEFAFFFAVLFIGIYGVFAVVKNKVPSQNQIKPSY